MMANDALDNVPSLTVAQLAQACTNYHTFLKENKLDGTLLRAMSFKKEDIQAILDAAPGPSVRIYYGILDESVGEKFAGKHLFFMAPAIDKPTVRVASLLSAKPTVMQLAMPECIGQTPPCPATNDQFVQTDH